MFFQVLWTKRYVNVYIIFNNRLFALIPYMKYVILIYSLQIWTGAMQNCSVGTKVSLAAGHHLYSVVLLTSGCCLMRWISVIIENRQLKSKVTLTLFCLAFVSLNFSSCCVCRSEGNKDRVIKTIKERAKIPIHRIFGPSFACFLLSACLVSEDWSLRVCMYVCIRSMCVCLCMHVP